MLAASLALGLAAANLARCSPVPAAAALACARLPCALAVAGWWWGSERVRAIDRSVLAPRIGTALRAVVEVEETPRPGRFDIRVRALVVSVHEQVQLQLELGRAPPQGARLLVLGVMHPSNARLRRQGIHVVVRVDEWRIVGRRKSIGDALHRWLERDSAHGLHGERRAVLEGIVLGQTQGMSDTLLERFRASGLYHVLAVDGLKVAAVAGGTVALALWIGLGRIAAETLALVVLAGYVLAVGERPSVIRAAIAGALGSLAWITARERDRWHAWLVGAVVLLAWNPYYLLDAGFQLSFAAVASIFVVTPRVVRALEGYPVPRALAQVIGVSTACGLATAPITFVQFGQISLITVPANVVGVPIVVEMLGLAFATALVAPVLPVAASLLAMINGIGAAVVADCARFFGGLPAAQVRSPAAAAAVLALLVGAYAWRRARGAQAGLPPHRHRPAEDRPSPPPAARPDRR